MSDQGNTEGASLVERALADLAARQRGANRHLMPVGVIGPRAATDEQLRVAEQVAHALARAGMAIVGGGKGGVMEAAARARIAPAASPSACCPRTTRKARTPT